MMDRRGSGRKLLIASIGVAAVSWVACGGDDSTSGGTGSSGNNTGGSHIVVGNLVGVPFEASTAGSGGASGEQSSEAGAPDAASE